MSAFSSVTVKELQSLNSFSASEAFSGIATALSSNGAASAVYGASFAMSGSDGKYLILIQNSASSGSDKTVTVKAGNGIHSSADICKTDLGFGEYTLICLESGRVKNIAENEEMKTLSSADSSSRTTAKGKVFITGSDANIKVAVFRLP